MEQRIYGYVRVSSRDQNEERQLLAMRDFPVQEKNIFVEKQSGKDFDRPEYKRMLRRLRGGDLLVIKNIDRLGRNYEAILEQWRFLTKQKRVHIVVLDMPLLDTRNGRNLTGTLIADIVLQLLSYVAEQERKNIRERQKEGILAAKKRGVLFGRPPIRLPENFGEIRELWEHGEITATEAGRRMNMSRQTFMRKAVIKKTREALEDNPSLTTGRAGEHDNPAL